MIVLVELLLEPAHQAPRQPDADARRGADRRSACCCCIFAFLEPPAARSAPRPGRPTIARTSSRITSLVLLVYGIIGIGSTPFIGPRGVYVAPTGSVFVADTANNRVVLIWKNGYRQTIGDGLLTARGRRRRRRPNGLRVHRRRRQQPDRAARAATTTTRSARTRSTWRWPPASGRPDVARHGAQGPAVRLGRTASATSSSPTRATTASSSSTASTLRAAHVPHGARRPARGACADPFYTEGRLRREHRRGHGARGAAERQGARSCSRGSTSPRASPRTPGATCTSRRWATGRSSRSPNHGLRPSSIDHARGLGHPRGLSVDALGNLFISDTDAGQVKIVASLREHQLAHPRHARIRRPSAYAPYGCGLRRQTGARGSAAGVGPRLAAHRRDRARRTRSASRPGRTATVWVGPREGELCSSRRPTAPSIASSRRRDLDGPRAALRRAGRERRRARRRRGRGPRSSRSPPRARRSRGSDCPAPHAPGGASPRTPSGDVVVGLANGDVVRVSTRAAKRRHLFNLRGITAIAMDRYGNSYTASSRYRPRRDARRGDRARRGRQPRLPLVERPHLDRRAASCGSSDKKSIGLFKVDPDAVLHAALMWNGLSSN